MKGVLSLGWFGSGEGAASTVLRTDVAARATRRRASASPLSSLHGWWGGAIAVALALGAGGAHAANPAYTVENIAAPAGVNPECGGLDVLPDGKVAAVFDHGEVCFYDPVHKTWRQFAEGMHTPLGIMAISDREVLVCQRAELTRIRDSQGTGVADTYTPVTDQWGISGNYHEFAYGPVRTPDGQLFVALGNGSTGSVARYETRGKLNPAGYTFGADAMFSVVPYRGWILRVEPDGSLTPWACGFRQPDGMVVDPQGRLMVTDNQGDWVGTSKLHIVERGGFYGHPSGLVWTPDFASHPHPTVLELDRRRHEGAVLFPHAILANSPGQPIFDLTHGKFGPFAGQMFVTEFNIPRLLRVMFDTVAGETQGAVTTFFDGYPLRAGNIRLAFSPDGSLYVGQDQRVLGWPADQGIQRVRWNGTTPMDVLAMRLTATGFRFTFTKPVGAAGAGMFSGERYYYVYHPEYGSPRTDVHKFVPQRVAVSADGLTVEVEMPQDLHAGYIYQFNLKGLAAADGAPIANPLIAYTANRLMDGASRPVPRPEVTGEADGSGKDQPAGSLQ